MKTKISMRNYCKIQKQTSVSAEEQKVLGFFHACSEISEQLKDENFEGVQGAVEKLEKYSDYEITHSAWISAITSLSQIPFSWIDRFSGKARRMYGLFKYGMIPGED